jgi:formylglycine-generating enzyme required for sulfatase activity
LVKKLVAVLILCLSLGAVAALAQSLQGPGNPEVPGMSLIPAGDYWMGRVHFFIMHEIGWLQRDRLDDEPAHKIHIDSFYIDKYEVSNEEYKRFADETKRETPWHWPHGNFTKGEERIPVTNVDWDDAGAYCKWAGKRLPSEAEWEKAARGGLDRQMFPWGNEGVRMRTVAAGQKPTPTGKHANTNYPAGPLPIGSYPPNGYGLFDMAGNVWEWTNDWYTRDYYSFSPRKNPHGPETGTYRVIRGGGWSDSVDEQTLMNNYRNYTYPNTKTFTIGFRCVKKAQVPSAQ